MPRRVTLPYDFEPREYQQRYMDHYDHGGHGGVWIWHRRAGKDLVSLHQTVKMMHQRVGMYWHCLPTYTQARKAVWNNFNNTSGKRLLRAIFPKEIVKHPDDFRPQAEMLIETKNGSILQIIGSDNIDNIVGAGPLHVTFSEYALCKPNSYSLIKPMLRESGGTVSFITTPRGRNHAWDIFEVAGREKGWVRDHQSLVDTGAWRFWKTDTGEGFASPEEVMAAERAAGMQPELVRQEYLCDWTAALVGSVYGDLMEVLEKNGAICDFEADGTAFTAWDLGLNDSTAIWFMVINGHKIDFVDYYEAHGKPLSHFFEHVEMRAAQHGLEYKKHWLPFDAKAKTLASQVSVLDQFIERYGSSKVDIAPKLSPIDGIQAARWLLQQKIRFHKRITLGIEVLKQYHYEFDEGTRSYSNRPEHDWSSHGADAFRYAALVTRTNQLLAKPPPPKPPQKPLFRTYDSFTLNELWDTHDRRLRRGIGRIS